MKKFTPAVRTQDEREAAAEFEESRKQPNDFRRYAARLEALVVNFVFPRPDLLQDAQRLRDIADAVEAMKNESIY